LSPVIRQLLLDSDLVTILPLVVVENEVATGALKVLPFDDDMTFPIHLTQRQATYPSPARDYVVGELEQLFRDRAGRKPAEARPRARQSRGAVAPARRAPPLRGGG
jgi:DNA-binding transcriptional LysR family regulator